MACPGDPSRPLLDGGPDSDSTVDRLRFVVCGSVDDGKSTLIGRMLYDGKLLMDDQLAALSRESAIMRNGAGSVDFSLLVDGLQAEREQGITIDVAYRFFATPARRFLVADAPGHEEYTRNMATAASTSDVAVVLVDARRGVGTQTRRHLMIAALLGIRHVIVAVNKMDLVAFDRRCFDAINKDIHAACGTLGVTCSASIPVVATDGDNIAIGSPRMDWYTGPTLLSMLEEISVTPEADAPLRLPIQYVNRLEDGRRAYCGTLASGSIASGDAVIVVPGRKPSRVVALAVAGLPAASARAGDAVAVYLEGDFDVGRGFMLVAPERQPEVSDQFEATIVWFDRQPLIPARQYILRTESIQTTAAVTSLKYRVDVESRQQLAAHTLAMNDIGTCNLSTQAQIAFDPYESCRATGSFILIDRLTHATVGAGLVRHSLRRARNLHEQPIDIDRSARALQKQQRPAVIWLTGLSGAGKSTIANLLDRRLYARGHHAYVLDGDNVRLGLNRDLGFTERDRVENIRRVAEVVRLMADAGLIVIVSFISPFAADRQMARERIGSDLFVEVFIDTPVEECARRDTKGLYERAMRGEIVNFTGVDSPYESPSQPDVRLTTVGRTPDQATDELLDWLGRNGRLN